MKFSVVIPLYNKEKYIRNCVRSALNQTLLPSEVIVVNDGSTDRSFEILSSIKSPLVKVFNQKNQGLSATRNRGIKLSNESLVAFLDADDQWHPDFLLNIGNLQKKFPEASIYGTSYYDVIKQKNVPAKHSVPESFKGKDIIATSFFEYNYNHFIPNMSTLCIKKNDFPEKVFNNSIDYHEDVDFFLRHVSNLKVALLFSPLAYINTHWNDRMSNSVLNNKRLPDLLKFENHYKNSKEAIKFINQQKLKYLIKSKMNNDQANIIRYKSIINLSHLSLKKKILIYIPNKMLLKLMKLNRLVRSWFVA